MNTDNKKTETEQCTTPSVSGSTDLKVGDKIDVGDFVTELKEIKFDNYADIDLHWFYNERGEYKELEDVETFTLFNEKNIEEYYTKNILKEQTPEEKTTEEILKDAKSLHEDLRNYGSIQDNDKPLIVSGILLALREME